MDSLLYVHPNGHLNDLVVPAGVLTSINSVAVPKLGRYAFEVTDDEIRAARVIAVDLHWALAISGFTRLIPHLRRVNSRAPIVVGGITAGHYAEELLDRFPIDYVFRGDSEVSFAALIASLFSDRKPEGLANVLGRGLPLPPLRRMTLAEFDATDPLTADWFPTYCQVSNWNAVAFPQGRTIPVSRGCAFSCPECYGSYASIYGPGYLLRSPQGLARLLRQASSMGLRNLRLFVAKPPPSKLTALLRELAAQGPFRFSSTVGLYLCTPPSEDDLRLIEDAFQCEVAISMIPPEEHVPALAPKRLVIEQQGWMSVARAARRSGKLNLDAWTTARGNFDRTRDLFETRPPHPRVKVSFGAVWSVTRPTDTGDQHTYEEVEEAVFPLWTFYAARLLSPALATLLAPFQYLDELDSDPELQTPPGATELQTYFEIIRQNWRTHHLPMLPGLGLSLLWVGLRPGCVASRRAPRINLGGELRFLPGDAVVIEDGGVAPLVFAADHRGVRLQAELPIPQEGGHLAVIPQPLPSGRADLDWARSIGAHGLVALELAHVENAPQRIGSVDVYLRVQDAQVQMSENGAVQARGRADIGYFPRVGRPDPARKMVGA